MKRFFCFAVVALCLGLTMASCGDKDKDLEKDAYIINGHRFVDLGLPSGLLWADCNVGAKDDLTEGSYFAWGATNAKKEYWWDNYEYGTSETNITKYNKTDGLTTLERADDAAASWGSSCRMPTKAEFEELVKNCTWTKTEYLNSKERSVIVYEVKSNKNDKSILFVISGYYDGVRKLDVGKACHFWTSDLNPDDVSTAYGFIVSGGDDTDVEDVTTDIDGHTGMNSRYMGFNVRPVATR